MLFLKTNLTLSPMQNWWSTQFWSHLAFCFHLLFYKASTTWSWTFRMWSITLVTCPCATTSFVIISLRMGLKIVNGSYDKYQRYTSKGESACRTMYCMWRISVSQVFRCQWLKIYNSWTKGSMDYLNFSIFLWMEHNNYLWYGISIKSNNVCQR